MTPQSTKTFIEKDIALEVCDISHYRSNKYNQSFRIDVNASEKSKAFDPSIWTQGLIVKPFRHPKPRRYSLNVPHDNHYRHHDQFPTDKPYYHEDQSLRPLIPDNRYDLSFQHASPRNKHFTNYNHV